MTGTRELMRWDDQSIVIQIYEVSTKNETEKCVHDSEKVKYSEIKYR